MLDVQSCVAAVCETDGCLDNLVLVLSNNRGLRFVSHQALRGLEKC